MGDTRNYAALEWVIGEISDTLKEARQALEAYVEDPKDSTRIRFCLTHIHQVHGTLQMVEFHGASLLAEEMEQLAQALLSNVVSSAAEAHEVLMRSLLQLPIYLEHVKTQRDDHPGVILPLLNDLRAVRKQSFLSETNLFAPDLTPAQTVSGARHPVTADAAKLKQVLQKLREMYQFAAAAVLRGVKVEENLGYLYKVCSRLESLTTGTRCYPAWNLAAALAEGLERDDIELSVAVRGLLRHLARELRILTEKSPKSFDVAAHESLLKNLLYYVARVDGGSERTGKIKRDYQLDKALLFGASSARTSERDFISAPDPEAIRSVVVALQDEINAIKHILDISLTGQGGLGELAEVLPVVKRVADTLAVLGIGDLRKQIIEQHQALEEICEAGRLDEDRLMQVAGRIIEIEHRLLAIAKGAGKNRDLSSVDERGLEIDQAKSTVLAECQKGLEQAKDAIVEYIASKWDASHLANVSSLMSDIRGGLEIIPLPRPAAIMDTCGRYVQEQLLDAQITPDWQTLDKLADAIASVDYYVERLREEQDEDLDGILDIAEQSIQSLGYTVAPRQAAQASGEQIPDPVESKVQLEPENTDTPEPVADVGEKTLPVMDAEEQLVIDDEEPVMAAVIGGEVDEPVAEAPLDLAADDPAAESAPGEGFESEEAEIEEPASEPSEISLDVSADTNEDVEVAAIEESAAEETISAAEPPVAEEPAEESDIDDEIIEIFVEEAGEVQETLAEFFPQWRQDPNDQDSLTIVRRAFHTLKGSGRMVQAAAIGELAWSIENMLNRVIDHTIAVQDEHFALIDMVLAVLPEMVKAFEERRPTSQKALAEQYMAWAFASADGKIPADLQRAASRRETGGQVTADDAQRPVAVVAAPQADVEVGIDDTDDGDDLVLWEIFASEAESHLATVEDFIHQMEQAAPLYTPPSDNMQRALHTLKGSAHMAHVTPIAELATPLESFVKELRAYQVNLTDDILQLVKDGVAYTRLGLENIDQGRPVELPKLPQFLARTAELRELAVGPLVRQKEIERDGQKQVDPRLLSIFMAEEMKLLLDADKILQRWREAPTDQSEIDPLIMELTNLQIGATQANLPEMAGLSDLLRAIYEGCLSGSIDRRDELIGQLQHGHELLLDMVDAVAAGQNLQPPSEQLLESLRAFLASGKAADLQQPEDRQDLPLAMDETDSDEPEEIDYSLSSLASDEQPETDVSPATEQNAFEGGDQSEEIDYSLSPLAGGEQPEINESLIGGLSEFGDSDESEEIDYAFSPLADDEQPEADDSLTVELLEDGLATSGLGESDLSENSLFEDELPQLKSGQNELDEDMLFPIELEAHAEDLASYELPSHALGEDDAEAGGDFAAEEEPTQPESSDEWLSEMEAQQPELADDPVLDDTIGELPSEDLLSDDLLFDDLDVVEPPIEDIPVADVPSEELPVAQVSDDETVPAPPVLDLESDDFDQEIIEIFLEEADELIDELDEAIHTWESDWGNSDSADTMARALHTLKGGARLANLMDVGELTHEYETFLLGRRKSELDQAFFEAIHLFQDNLLRSVRNVQAALAGEPPMPEPKAPVVKSEKSADTVADEQERVPGQGAPAQAKANVVPFSPKPKELAANRDGDDFNSGFSVSAGKGAGPQSAAQVALRRSGPQEVIKISAELLEELVNLAGETSISRGRLETQVNDLAVAIDEIDGTLSRLQEQLRRLDIETEAQVIFRQEQLAEHEDFDPLEMDRYSALQQLSRSLMESASDLIDLKATLTDKVKDTETLLLQQSRVNTNLQEGLMRSRMVPFSRLVPRLRRIVRQVAGELGKDVNLEMDNIEGEMDRSVLERMVAPLEHMLRNAVDHGIEKPADRVKAGKPEAGRVTLSLAREGGDVLLRLADDGRGIDLKRVREKAIERGLMSEDAQLSDHDIMQFILHAGFSTAESVTQISGRGVGMDVVHAEIKQLGGSMSIASRAGEGTEFSVRLPFTVSVNRALMINLGQDQYAVPLNAIEGIVRVSPFELEHYYSDPEARFEYAGEHFRMRYLGSMLNDDARPRLEAQSLPLPVILVRSEQHTMALQVDSLTGSREIVVKSLGSQFSTVQGLSGATVMGDGSVVVILDLHALVRKDMALAAPAPVFTIEETARLAQQEAEALKTVMVVDDSVTVRKVTTRFLEREGYNVITAKDGVDALRILQDEIPDIMLLDIEMPRMDGFEVAKNIRTTSRWQDIPIIMITSRTGEKHREHALSLGVNRYMGKPYQEETLLESINELLTHGA